jgi:predicted metal-dependent HD superfamily phosphohydrolase
VYQPQEIQLGENSKLLRDNKRSRPVRTGLFYMVDFSKAKQYVVNLLESDLSKGFLYHDLNHTLDVYRSASELGKSAQLSEQEQMILETAALYHDVGLIFTMEGHEEKSIEIVQEKLPQFGYSESDIHSIIGLIQATRLPQNPQNYIEMLLCDADLDYLGRDDFFVLASKLQLEWRRLNFKDIPFDEWIAFEKEFLSNHSYFTKEAKAKRDSGKRDNLNQLKNICK